MMRLSMKAFFMGLAQCDRMLGHGKDADDYPLANAYAARHTPSQRNADGRRADRAPESDNPKRTVNGLLKAARENGWSDPRGCGTPIGEMPTPRWDTQTDLDNALRLIATCAKQLTVACDPDAGEVSVYATKPNGLLTDGETYMKALLAKTAGAYAQSVMDANLSGKEFGVLHGTR